MFPYHTRINNPTPDPLTLYPKTKNLEDITTAARNMNICFEFSIHPTVSPLCYCRILRPLLAPVHPCPYLNPLPPLYPCTHFGVYSLHPCTKKCTYLGLLFAHACNVQCTVQSLAPSSIRHIPQILFTPFPYLNLLIPSIHISTQSYSQYRTLGGHKEMSSILAEQ